MCYYYATKSNSRTMRSQISQRESADERVDMSELQAVWEPYRWT